MLNIIRCEKSKKKQIQNNNNNKFQNFVINLFKTQAKIIETKKNLKNIIVKNKKNKKLIDLFVKINENKKFVFINENTFIVNSILLKFFIV